MVGTGRGQKPVCYVFFSYGEMGDIFSYVFLRWREATKLRGIFDIGTMAKDRRHKQDPLFMFVFKELHFETQVYASHQ